MNRETKYPTEALLKSGAFSIYQPDFAGAVLTEPEYTVRAAKERLDRFFGKDVN